MPDVSASQGFRTELRHSGIDILGELPWGSHFCNFFESKEDLLQILVPYFKAGLINNEFCLWITSDPISVEVAYEAMRNEIQDFDKYESKEQITILSHSDWYLNDKTFVPDIVINGWYQKLSKSLNLGFDGMRVSGNEAWLDRDIWKNFIDYERNLNNSLTDKRMIVLCTYPLAKCDAHAVFDVSQVHEIAVTRRRGDWEIVEVPAIKKTKSQLARDKKELEEKVAERTKELTVINARLESEIEQHKITLDALLRTKARLLTVFDATDTAYLLLESDLSILLFNHQAADYVRRVFNWNLKAGDNMHDFLPADRQILFTDRAQRAIKGEQISFETRYDLENESFLWYHVRLLPIPHDDKEIFGFVLACTDITQRKQLESQLERERMEKQREITNAVITAEENERQEIGRELHDNIQQILVSARLFLSMINKKDISDSGYSFLQQSNQMILSAFNEIRNLSHSMITPFIEETTMKEAIEKLIFNTTTASGIEISMEAIGMEEEKLPEKLRLSIYRIIQEQFSNILKYAKASTALLKIVQDNEKLTLTIKDNGIGFDTTKKASGIGLMNIKARASLFNGEVAIRSSPGQGFELYVIMKLK
ncbi:MAG: MEDS domain-containing protein [Flavisolibacter sp.]